MENTKNSSFIHAVKEYLELRWEIYSLTATARIADVCSSFFTLVIAVLIAGITILFLSLSAAYLIGQSLNDTGMGFLIVAGFYLLLMLIVLVFKRPLIKKPVENSIIKQIVNKPN